MTNKLKLKYFLLTIITISLCAITTAFPIKGGGIVVDLTYGLLLLIAFLFGGWICGISGVFGICLYNLLNNNTAWIALLGLVLGLSMGVMAWLTRKLFSKNSFDKSVPMIAAGSFFLGLGIIFTTARCCVGQYYTIPREEIQIIFNWPLYVLPFIIGATFIITAFINKKLPSYVTKPITYTAMIAPASMLVYSIVAILSSLRFKRTFVNEVANAFNHYISNFLISCYICILAAIVIYILSSLFIIFRRKIREAE